MAESGFSDYRAARMNAPRTSRKQQRREFWRPGVIWATFNLAFVALLAMVAAFTHANQWQYALVVFGATFACSLALLVFAMRMSKARVDEQLWRKATETNRQLTATIALLFAYGLLKGLEHNSFANSLAAFFVVGIVFQTVGPAYSSFREAMQTKQDRSLAAATRMREAASSHKP